MSFSPEPDQIGTVRDIVEISSKAEVAARIGQYCDDADWAETLNDITEWEKIKNKFYESKDIPLKYAAKRLAITNRVRVRLGYPKLNENGMTVANFDEDDYTRSVDVNSW